VSRPRAPKCAPKGSLDTRRRSLRIDGRSGGEPARMCDVVEALRRTCNTRFPLERPHTFLRRTQYREPRRERPPNGAWGRARARRRGRSRLGSVMSGLEPQAGRHKTPPQRSRRRSTNTRTANRCCSNGFTRVPSAGASRARTPVSSRPTLVTGLREGVEDVESICPPPRPPSQRVARSHERVPRPVPDVGRSVEGRDTRRGRIHRSARSRERVT